MARIIRKEGSTVPSAIQKAPQNPFNLYPMKMAMLTAKIPGTVCASAIKSRKSSFFTHFRLSTRSASIKGTMAYPPPMVNSPIRKKMRNAFM